MAAAPIPTVELPDLVTFEQVAERYGFSLRSMREAANREEFEHVRFGNSLRFTPAQLEAFIELKTRKPQRAVPAQRGSRTRARVQRERARRAPATT